MRRLFCLLLCLLMLPVFAFAAPQTPYDPSTLLRYSFLSPKQQALVDLLYQGAAGRAESIALPEGAAYDDAEAAVELLVKDFPELTHLTGQYAISYYQNTPQLATRVTLVYNDTDDTEALLAAVRAICTDAIGAPVQKVEFFHDAVCRLVTYTPELYGLDGANTALLQGQAVCNGYAQAMSLLCRLAGIPCSVVSGNAAGNNHAWNAMELNGSLSFTDATWDDQNDVTLHSHVNMSLEQISRTHFANEDLPFASDDRNEYFRVHGLLAESAAEAETIFASGVSTLVKTGAPLEMRFATRNIYDAIAGDLDGALDRANAVNPSDAQLYGSYSFRTDGDQLCLYLSR